MQSCYGGQPDENNDFGMSMRQKQVFLPAELIDMLSEVVRSEGYVFTFPVEILEGQS